MVDYITKEDMDYFGSDLLNVSQRAALHAVAPHLQNLEQQNAELSERLRIEAKHRLDQEVERVLPNYREIDRDPNWHRWLLSTDPLSGRTRQGLLNDAVRSGSAQRVIAFFQGFLREHQVANQASGRARTRSTSSDKPIYSRDRIGQLYELHRKGAYAGREADWARQEADIFAAQREGRVHDVPYITK